jgi:hypothetical protein
MAACAAATLEPLAVAVAVDQDSPHSLGRRGEEMTAAVPGSIPIGPDQSGVSLMDEGRRLERLARLLARQPMGGQLAQLLIHEREQFLGRPGIALLDRQEDSRDLGHRGIRPAHSRPDRVVPAPCPRPLHPLWHVGHRSRKLRARHRSNLPRNPADARRRQGQRHPFCVTSTDDIDGGRHRHPARPMNSAPCPLRLLDPGRHGNATNSITDHGPNRNHAVSASGFRLATDIAVASGRQRGRWKYVVPRLTMTFKQE